VPLEDIVKPIKKMEIKQEVIDKPVEEAVSKPEKGVMGGPDAYFIVEWNRQTMKMFNKYRKPKQGRRYCLKCVRNDGRRIYFVLDQL